MRIEDLLDVKDRKILYQLDIDCRRPNSAIGRLVGLGKQSVDYRIRRLAGSGIITRFSTVVDTYRLGLGKFKVYISLESANRSLINGIVGFLKRDERTEWVATCAGRWDVIAGYLARDVYEFNDALREFDERYSQHVSSKETTLTLGVPHWRKDYLLDVDERYPVVMQGTERRERVAVDETDERIIRVLINNGRMPVTDIARRLKLTQRVVDYRMERLKREHVILISRIAIDLNRLGWIFCKAFLKFRNLTKERYRTFFGYCKLTNNLTYLISCVGPWDVELDFEIQDFNGFYAIMLDIRDKFSDIIRSYDYVVVTSDDKLDYYPGAYPAEPQ